MGSILLDNPLALSESSTRFFRPSPSRTLQLCHLVAHHVGLAVFVLSQAEGPGRAIAGWTSGCLHLQ